MPKLTLQKAVLFASSAIGLAAATPSWAQEAAGDIIVTARRVEERLQDVPISITVFNQQQLTNRNVVSAGDIATYTPSLSSNGRFGSENTSFAIRGFVQDNGTAPSVAVYFADVATLRAAGGTTLGNGAGPGAFFDLANVQVLKGAQGTLFGRNTTGGAVLLVPQKPTGKFEGYVEGSIGNYDMRRIQAVVNVPVMDSLRVRVGVDRQTRDGFLNNYSPIGPRDFADVDYTAVRFSAVADLTPNLENYFIATYSDSNTSGFLPQVFNCAPGTQLSDQAKATANAGCAQVSRLKATGDYYAVENGTSNPRQHVQQWQLINTTTWRASDTLTIKNILSYGQFREYFRASVYGEYLPIPGPFDSKMNPNAGQNLIKAQTSPRPGQQSAAESTFTEELQFQGTGFGSRLNWQAGVYTEQSEPLGFSGSSSISSGVCPANATDSFSCISAQSPTLGGTSIINERLNHQRFQDYGVFGQGTYKLNDQFSITGGIRYTWDSTTAVTRQAVYLLPAVSGGTLTRLCQTGTSANECQQQFHIASSAPTWMVDLDYKPTEDMLLYAKYTRGYRAGGLKIDGGPVFNTFEPEKVDSYEAGLKSSINGPIRATFNIAGFYSKFLSQQLAARLDPTLANPNQQPPQTIASGARSRVYGVEVEASVTPVHGLTIDANYAYLNTRLTSVAPVSGSSALYFPPVPTGTAVGYPLGYAPKNKYSITGSYTLPLDESIGKITVGGTYSHSDSQWTAIAYVTQVAVNNTAIPANFVGNPGLIPAINLVNANVNWSSVGGSPVDLSFFVTNLTKEKYTVSVFGGIGAFGYDARALGEPRMYGFRLKYRFGG
ncbi:MAG TPA: TonB-dependent receptor [Sphingobium sp.]|uniref:TonB-dependent receptor n=1 Tax=Sphingobium sp. TaxID=1912891 RepID=UPI002ECFEB5E